MASLKSDGSHSQTKSQSGVSNDQIFTHVGFYKGVLCAVKTVNATNYKLNRKDLIELKVVNM